MYCTNCGKEVDDNVLICPNCDTKLKESTSNTTNRILISFLIPVIILIIVFISVMLMLNGINSSTYQNNQITYSKPKLEILESSICGDSYGIKYICGTLKNNSNRNYGYIQVEINLLDSDGNIVGSTIDNINNLGPEQSWKFKAIITENSATSYEIKDITGF